MAHNILIDENNQIVDGYVSLLIADKHKDNMKKWQNPEIYKVNALVPHAKVVIGRHVDMSGTDIIIKDHSILHGYIIKKNLLCLEMY